MRIIADSCPSGPCPRVYDLGDGEVVVQGYLDHRTAVPPGEALVRLPAYLIIEAAEALRIGSDS